MPAESDEMRLLRHSSSIEKAEKFSRQSGADSAQESAVYINKDLEAPIFLGRYNLCSGVGVTIPSVSAVGGRGGSCVLVGSAPVDVHCSNVYDGWFTACLECDSKAPPNIDPLLDDLGPLLLCPPPSSTTTLTTIQSEGRSKSSSSSSKLSQGKFARFCALQGLVETRDADGSVVAQRTLFEEWTEGVSGGRSSSNKNSGGMERTQFKAFCAATWGSPRPVTLKLMCTEAFSSSSSCGALERELACRRSGTSHSTGGSGGGTSSKSKGSKGSSSSSSSSSSSKLKGLSPLFVLPILTAHGGNSSSAGDVAKAVGAVWPDLAPSSSSSSALLPAASSSSGSSSPPHAHGVGGVRSSSFVGAVSFAPCGPSLEHVSRLEMTCERGGGGEGHGHGRSLVSVQQLLRSVAQCFQHLHEQGVVLGARGCGLHPVVASGLQSMMSNEEQSSGGDGGDGSGPQQQLSSAFALSGPSVCLPPARCFVRPGGLSGSGGVGDRGSGSDGGSDGVSGQGGRCLMVRDLECSANIGETVALPPWAIASAIAAASSSSSPSSSSSDSSSNNNGTSLFSSSSSSADTATAASSASSLALPYFPIAAHAPPEVAWYACACSGVGVSKEDAAGAPVLSANPSLDAWSLGCMAYELCCGNSLMPQRDGRLVGGARAARRLSAWGYADCLNAVAAMHASASSSTSSFSSLSSTRGGVDSGAVVAVGSGDEGADSMIPLSSSSSSRAPVNPFPSASCPWDKATPLGLFCDLVCKLLDPLPARRPSMTDVLRHPFFAINPRSLLEAQTPTTTTSQTMLNLVNPSPPLLGPPVFLPPLDAATQDLLARLDGVLLKTPLTSALQDHQNAVLSSARNNSNTDSRNSNSNSSSSSGNKNQIKAGTTGTVMLGAVPPALLVLTQRLDDDASSSSSQPFSVSTTSLSMEVLRKETQQAMLWFDALASLGESLEANPSSSSSSLASSSSLSSSAALGGAGVIGGSIGGIAGDGVVAAAAELAVASKVAGRVNFRENERLAPFGGFSGAAGSAAAYGGGTRRTLYVYAVNEATGKPVGISAEGGGGSGGVGGEASGGGGSSRRAGGGMVGNGDGDLVFDLLSSGESNNGGGGGRVGVSKGGGCLELEDPTPSQLLTLLPFARLGLKAVATVHGPEALERLFFPKGVLAGQTSLESSAITITASSTSSSSVSSSGSLPTEVLTVPQRCVSACGSLDASGSRVEFDALLIAASNFEEEEEDQHEQQQQNELGGNASAAVARKSASAVRRAGALSSLASLFQRFDPHRSSALVSAVLCPVVVQRQQQEERKGGEVGDISSPLEVGLGNNCLLGRVVWAARGSSGHGGGEGSGLALAWSEPLWSVHGGCESMAVSGAAVLGTGAAAEVGAAVRRLGEAGLRRRRAGATDGQRANELREQNQKLERERRRLQLQLDAVTCRLEAIEENGGGGGGGRMTRISQGTIGSGSSNGGGGLLDRKTKEWLEQRHEEVLEAQAVQAEKVNDNLGKVKELLETLVLLGDSNGSADFIGGSGGGGSGDHNHNSRQSTDSIFSRGNGHSGGGGGGGGNGGGGGGALHELIALRKLVSGQRSGPVNADDLFRDTSPTAAVAGRAPPPRSKSSIAARKKKGKLPPPPGGGLFGRATAAATPKRGGGGARGGGSSSNNGNGGGFRSASADDNNRTQNNGSPGRSVSLTRAAVGAGSTLDRQLRSSDALTDVSQTTTVSNLSVEALDDVEGRMDKLNQHLGEIVVEQITEQMIELMNEQMNHQAAQQATHQIVKKTLDGVESLEQSVNLGLNKHERSCGCSVM